MQIYISLLFSVCYLICTKIWSGLLLCLIIGKIDHTWRKDSLNIKIKGAHLTKENTTKEENSQNRGLLYLTDRKRLTRPQSHYSSDSSCSLSRSPSKNRNRSSETTACKVWVHKLAGYWIHLWKQRFHSVRGTEMFLSALLISDPGPAQVHPNLVKHEGEELTLPLRSHESGTQTEV